MKSLRKLVALAGAVATSFALVSCAEQEPKNDRVVEAAPVIEILVLGDYTEQAVRAELYAQTMTRMGHEATLKLLEPGSNPIVQLSQGNGDVYIACAGKQVDLNNRSEAKRLEAEYAELEGENTPASMDQKREEAYAALMASMINNLDATDPSNAIGCAYLEGEEATELANNLVPIYRVPILDREERQMLNYMSGTLTTEDLADLVDKVDRGQDMTELVSEYLDEKGI